MRAFSLRHTVVLLSAIVAAPFIMGAEGNGCGGDVLVGSDEPCEATGCSGTVCSDEDVITTCEWSAEYACYAQFGQCERAQDGACGWVDNAAFTACLANGGPDPEPCVVTGCSGQLCAEVDTPSDCAYLPEYACYSSVGVCERDAGGACGWRQSPELIACINDPREPVNEGCVKSSNDACETDADCMGGGCGGELCFNPAVSGGRSTCECSAPSLGCGCVQGSCTWYQ